MAASSTHLDDDEVVRFALGESVGSVVRDHLKKCDVCNARVKSDRAVISDIRRNFIDREGESDPIGAYREPPRDGSSSGGAEDAGEEVGAVIGDYRLLKVVGRGGQGVVYLARQVHTGKEVALKLVNPGGRSYALRELAMTVDLEHEHLIRIHHVGEHAGRLYFTMKLAENGSLDRKIEEYRLQHRPVISSADRGRVEERKKKICEFMARIARAVHYLHEQGILHLDLKPGNILLDAQGEPLVIDLGVSRRFRDAAVESAGNGLATTEQGVGDSTAIGVGSLGYIPPELLQGPPELHRPVDVYALGVVLYELLTRHRPFEGTEDEIHAQTTDMDRSAPEPSLYNPNIQNGSELELICLKCLKKQPGDRFASAADLAQDLDSCARGEETSVRPRSSIERIARHVVKGINHKLSLPGIARWGAIDLWDAGLNLAVNGAFFALIRANQPPVLLWLVFLTYYAVWWWMFLSYLFRRDPVDSTECHLALLWGGVFLAGITLFWIYCPPFGPGRTAGVLAFYPPWTVVNGMAFLIVGRLYWGVYYLVGLAHFLVAALMPLRLDLAPLVYGVFVAVCMSLAAVDHIRTGRRQATSS
jgi:serine/threonine-protein kinase